MLVSPITDRVLDERDDDSREQAVAVLSYRFWKQRFGGDYGIIGKRLLPERIVLDLDAWRSAVRTVLPPLLK